MEKKTFILHWIGGKTEVIKGYDIVHAFNKHYSRGAIRVLDYYEEKKEETNESN